MARKLTKAQLAAAAADALVEGTTLEAQLTPPTPTPDPAPTVSTENPQVITLEREGETGKRYVSKTEPDSKYHLRDRSLILKPVAVVKQFCEDAVNEDGEFTLTRKQVIDQCVALGVNKHTAMTQYSLWKAANFPGATKQKLSTPATAGKVTGLAAVITALDEHGNPVPFEG